MRINEILTESQQLDEGPLGAIGRGIGKVVGGAAKGIGAIAGGVVGAGTALKKGYQSGKAVVGDDPDPNAGKPGYTPPEEAPAAAPTGGAAPAPTDPKAAPAGGAVPAPTDPKAAPAPAGDPKAAAPAPAADPAADAAAADDTARAGEKIYSQVKANIDKLDNEGKTRILDLVKKSIQSTPAEPDASAAGGAAGDPKAAAPAPAGDPKAAADAAAADPAAAGGKPPNTMANAPVSATNKADPSNPNLAAGKPPAADADATATAPAGQGAFANVAQQLSKPAKDPAVKAAADAALAKPGFQRTASDKLAIKAAAETKSLVHRGKSLNEIFAQKLEIHKRRMFESALAKGTASVFVK